MLLHFAKNNVLHNITEDTYLLNRAVMPRSGLRLCLCVGVISTWSQFSGNLEVLYDC